MVKKEGKGIVLYWSGAVSRKLLLYEVWTNSRDEF